MQKLDLTAQLHDPQHVYLRSSVTRKLLRHSRQEALSPILHLEGEPVRFTRQAAERVVQRHPHLRMEEV